MSHENFQKRYILETRIAFMTCTANVTETVQCKHYVKS